MPETHDEKLATHDALTEGLVDRGMLIEAGFAIYTASFISAEVSPSEVRGRRDAFFLGAQHVFASLLAIVNDGLEEATSTGMLRMNQIESELEEFAAEFDRRTKASAADQGGKVANSRPSASATLLRRARAGCNPPTVR